MIKYQYVHTASGYEARLSLPRENENYTFNETLFETLREIISGDFFAYATVGNNENAAFLKAGTINNHRCLEGLILGVGEVREEPAAYMETFQLNTNLSSVIMPRAGQAPNFAIFTNLHHIFGKLVDALLYGDPNKPIIIVADNNDAVKYLRALSLILPKSYMKRVGFCVGCESVVDSVLSIRNGDRDCAVGMRIVLPNISNFNFEYYASAYYVFDMRGSGVDNYSLELHSIGKLIDEIDLTNIGIRDNYVRQISQAFKDDGSVDYTLLEQTADLGLLELRGDISAARQVLRNNANNDTFVAKSIGVMLNDNNCRELTADDRRTIHSHYVSNQTVAQAIEGRYYVNLCAEYRSLSFEEKETLVQIIAADGTGEKLSRLLDQVRYADFQALKDAFSISISVLVRFFQRSGLELMRARGLVNQIVTCFDVSTIINKIPMEQHTHGEEFFELIAEVQDDEIKAVLAGCLMMSAYKQVVCDGGTEVRIRGLKRLAEKCFSKFKQIDFIINVKSKMDVLVEFSPGAERQYNFLLDNNFGKLWVRGLVDYLAPEELLSAVEKIRIALRNNYESLLELLHEKLLNISFVKTNVRCGQPIYERYREFFTLLGNVQYAHKDVEEYLNKLQGEEFINSRFAEYRYNFAYDCYRTLSDNDKRKIASSVNAEVVTYHNMLQEKRTQVVEKTVKEFGTIENAPKNKARAKTPFIIWSLMFAVVAAILLVLPAVVQMTMMQKLDPSQQVGSILSFINPFYAILPIGVFALHAITYSCLKYRNTLKRANIITLLCGILPVVVFVLAYIVFYLLGVSF